MTSARALGALSDAEISWRDRQPWLEEHGYMLRPRYRPDWKPSWEGTTNIPLFCEDGRMLRHPHILDATRLSDGTIVTLKKIKHSIIEVLQDPFDQGVSIIMMPLLKRYNEPPFSTVGEAVEFFRQALEGLHFMHQNRVAHRDLSSLNVMMDPMPLYPKLYHPTNDSRTRDYIGGVKPYTRTERPTRYYFIDFGLSRKYSSDEDHPLEIPILGGDKSVPEFQGDGCIKPKEFLKKFTGLEFMNELVTAMVADDPQKRPTADGEAVDRFSALQHKLPWWKCRQRLVSRKEGLLLRSYRGFGHILRTTAYVLLRLPAVPTPLAH